MAEETSPPSRPDLELFLTDQWHPRRRVKTIHSQNTVVLGDLAALLDPAHVIATDGGSLAEAVETCRAAWQQGPAGLRAHYARLARQSQRVLGTAPPRGAFYKDGPSRT